MEINNLLEKIYAIKPLLAFLYVFLSFISAFIIDKIFISFFKTLVKKSKTDLDDKIVDAIHRPLYYTILFFGFSIAIKLLNLPEFIVSSFISGINLCQTVNA